MKNKREKNGKIKLFILKIIDFSHLIFVLHPFNIKILK